LKLTNLSSTVKQKVLIFFLWINANIISIYWQAHVMEVSRANRMLFDESYALLDLGDPFEAILFLYE